MSLGAWRREGLGFDPHVGHTFFFISLLRRQRALAHHLRRYTLLCISALGITGNKPINVIRDYIRTNNDTWRICKQRRVSQYTHLARVGR